MSRPDGDERIDVAIAGGGHVGLTLALALKRAVPSLQVTVVDATPADAVPDGRVYAVAAGGRRMLQQLGVWAAIAAEAQPINDMVITDSRTRDVARPTFLTFDGATEDGEPFAHMVANSAMVQATGEAARAAGAAIRAPDSVTGFSAGENDVAVDLASGGSLRARLLVAADGVRSKLRDLAGIQTVGWDYGQSGIVVTVGHERPHHGRAEEHFLPAGPFAILPLTGDRSSLVWTEARDNAERLVKATPARFQEELEARFGHHLGALTVLDRPRAFPLGLKLARAFVKPRFALAGDAAHGIHPIAGQGLNLGFRDVAALAETIVESHRLGLDPGSLAVLSRYERWRRFDTFEMGATTDILNRLFSNDNPALRIVRDVGLGLVDRLPSLKKMFIREAAGQGGELPRLLRGERI